MNPKIYIASKTRHADKWIELRNQGVNIISTWIDEAGPDASPDMPDLCKRCVDECLLCDAIIVYSEEGDYLKGAFIEMGVVLSRSLVPVYLVGPALPIGSAFTYSHQVFVAKSVEHAIELIKQ